MYFVLSLKDSTVDFVTQSLLIINVPETCRSFLRYIEVYSVSPGNSSMHKGVS